MSNESPLIHDDGTYVVRISPNHDRGRTRWRVDAYYRGHRKDTRACSVFGTEAGAQTCAAALWTDYLSGQHVAPEPAPLTVGTLVDRFCARKTGKRGRALSPHTERAYRSQLKGLVDVAGAESPVGHLGKRHVEAAVRIPKSQRSQFQYFVAIKALVAWAIKNEWLRVDITAGVQVDPGPSKMRPYLQPEEIDRFLAGCAPAHRIRGGLTIQVGLRPGEARYLRWSWIQRAGEKVSISIPEHDPDTGFTAKGKRVRVIPLSNDGVRFLCEAETRWGNSGFVLHDQERPPSESNWCHSTHEGCLRAGVTNIDAHGLRRTAGVLWLAADIDIYTVSRLLGHESVTTTEKAYAGIADSRLKGAINLLNAFAAPTPPPAQAPRAARPAPQVRRRVRRFPR